MFRVRGESLREEQAAAVIADVAGPLRAAAASILELEGHAASDPKSALAMLVAGSEFESMLPYISESRERMRLEPGTATS